MPADAPGSWFPREYSVYGVGIRSAFSLWQSSEVKPRSIDVEVTLDSSGGEYAASRGFELTAEDAVYRTPFGAMRVSGGRQIDWLVDPEFDRLAVPLLTTGPGLAMALAQRGRLVLHGACVLRGDGRAVCLAGASGAGKSSLAASLVQQGWSLISDGMTVLSFDAHGRALAEPGPRLLKLWPDAVERLGQRIEEVDRVVPEFEKRLVRLGTPAPAEAVPLAAVLLVASGEPVALTPLAGAASLVALAGVHFLSEYVGRASAARLLQDCARLRNGVAVARLARGQGPQQIGEALRLLQSFHSGSQPP